MIYVHVIASVLALFLFGIITTLLLDVSKKMDDFKKYIDEGIR